MSPTFSSLGELGDGYGFRKIRAPLGVTAFGVNAIVYPPGFDGFAHYHDTQDELYFVHRGRIRVEADGETRDLGEGGLFHAEGHRLRRVDLARQVLLTASGITRLLDGLERAGLVDKERCSSDARVTYAVLTESGLETIRSARESHAADIEELFGSRFSLEEKMVLDEMLSRLPLAETACQT